MPSLHKDWDTRSEDEIASSSRVQLPAPTTMPNGLLLAGEHWPESASTAPLDMDILQLGTCAGVISSISHRRSSSELLPGSLLFANEVWSQ